MTTYLQNNVERVAGQIQNQEKSAHDIISVQTDNSTSNLAPYTATERTANLHLQNISNVQETAIPVTLELNKNILKQEMSNVNQVLEPNTALEILMPSDIETIKKPFGIVTTSPEQAVCMDVFNDTINIEKIDYQGLTTSTRPLAPSQNAKTSNEGNNTIQFEKSQAVETANIVQTIQKESIPVLNIPQKVYENETKEEVAIRGHKNEMNPCTAGKNNKIKSSTTTSVRQTQAQDNLTNLDCKRSTVFQAKVVSENQEPSTPLQISVPSDHDTIQKAFGQVKKTSEQALCTDVLTDTINIEKVDFQGHISSSKPLASSIKAIKTNEEHNIVQLEKSYMVETATPVQAIKKESIPISNIPEKVYANETKEEVALREHQNQSTTCNIGINSQGKSSTCISQIQAQDILTKLDCIKEHEFQAIVVSDNLIDDKSSKITVTHAIPKQQFSIFPNKFTEEENIPITIKNNLLPLQDDSTNTTDALIKLESRPKEGAKQDVSAKFDVNINKISKTNQQSANLNSEHEEVSGVINIERKKSKKLLKQAEITPDAETLVYVQRSNSIKPSRATLKSQIGKHHQIISEIPQEIQNKIQNYFLSLR